MGINQPYYRSQEERRPVPNKADFQKRREWEAEARKAATGYVVNMWRGPGRWSSDAAATLEEAYAVSKQIGKDEHGRVPFIYGLLGDGTCVPVGPGIEP